MEDVTCSCRLLVNQVHYYIQLNSMLDEDGNFIKDKNVEKYFLCYGINNNRLIEEIDFFQINFSALFLSIIQPDV